MNSLQDTLFAFEDADAKGYMSAFAWNYKDDDEKAANEREGTCDKAGGDSEILEQPPLTVPGVMGWLTGLQHKPINDEKPAITVYFDHNCLERNNKHTICYPIISACGKQITFPIAHMNSPENFKEIFIVGYCKSQSFGRL